MKEIRIKPSEELAYWVGVAQSDGSLCKYLEKGRTKPKYKISMEVNEKSKLMLVKFVELSNDLFKRKSGIWKTNRDTWCMHIGVSNLIDLFQKIDIKFKDPPIPPDWCLKTESFFGAYLAGLIDGDGNVKIRRSKYPVCVVTISSGVKQIELCKAIKNKLKCGASVSKEIKKGYLDGRLIEGVGYRLEFLVSYKNIKFFKLFIVPYIQLERKKSKLENFINLREGNDISGPSANLVKLRALGL